MLGAVPKSHRPSWSTLAVMRWFDFAKHKCIVRRLAILVVDVMKSKRICIDGEGIAVAKVKTIHWVLLTIAWWRLTIGDALPRSTPDALLRSLLDFYVNFQFESTQIDALGAHVTSPSCDREDVMWLSDVDGQSGNLLWKVKASNLAQIRQILKQCLTELRMDSNSFWQHRLRATGQQDNFAASMHQALSSASSSSVHSAPHSLRFLPLFPLPTSLTPEHMAYMQAGALDTSDTTSAQLKTTQVELTKSKEHIQKLVSEVDDVWSLLRTTQLELMEAKTREKKLVEEVARLRTDLAEAAQRTQRLEFWREMHAHDIASSSNVATSQEEPQAEQIGLQAALSTETRAEGEASGRSHQSAGYDHDIGTVGWHGMPWDSWTWREDVWSNGWHSTIDRNVERSQLKHAVRRASEQMRNDSQRKWMRRGPRT